MCICVMIFLAFIVERLCVDWDIVYIKNLGLGACKPSLKTLYEGLKRLRNSQQEVKSIDAEPRR